MNTLVKHFQKRENALKSQLRKPNTLNQIVERIQDEIKSLRDINGEYIQELTPSQARVALKGLAELNQSLSLLTAVRPQASTPATDVRYSAQLASESSSKAIINIAVFSSTAVGVTGSYVGVSLIKKEAELLCDKYPNVQPIIIKRYPDYDKNVVPFCNQINQFSTSATIVVSPVIVGILIGSVIAVILAAIFGYLRKRNQRKNKPITNLAQTNRTHFDLADAILSYLQERLEDIDSEVAKEGNKTQPKTPTPKLEDHTDLLVFLQNLIGEVRDEQAYLPTLTNKRIEEIPEILKQNGIEVVFYQPGLDDTSKFDFVQSLEPDLKEHVTLIPAFIKDNHVLLRGRIVKPASF